MKGLIVLLLIGLSLIALNAYHRGQEKQLNARIAALEAELMQAKDDCETRIAVMKSEQPDDSCSRLEGKALTDFIGQLPPQTVTRFVEEFRKRSAMVRGYELPRGCADLLPPECFRKTKRGGRSEPPSELMIREKGSTQGNGQPVKKEEDLKLNGDGEK